MVNEIIHFKKISSLIQSAALLILLTAYGLMLSSCVSTHFLSVKTLDKNGVGSVLPKQNATLNFYSDWPDIKSKVLVDKSIETKVAVILAQMTIEEKVGQMIQPSLSQVAPAEAKQYKLGSLLNGGGSWPNKNKGSKSSDWVRAADSYWVALDEAYKNRGFKIPFMWATDAVHGHNNVVDATIFPHNIGLGAANDSDLIYRIGKATAREVAATGLDWTFSPTVAVPRDYHWGRVYEGYSEDPVIVFNYAGKMVDGLQGGTKGLKTDKHVIATVKHWIGDGGTRAGVDKGENRATKENLINIHAAGYFSGIEAGAQVVMSSFNSWHNDENYDASKSPNYNKKIHGSKYLITDVLKGKMGFDGIVITDWNGHREINGCTVKSCPAAVNAGNDIFMVTANQDWKAFYKNLVAQIKDGTIAMARIDDAVTRILRVKMRANLWNKPKPSLRALAGQQAELGSKENRLLAREAVRKSLVLLKNNNDVLPLKPTQQVYLAGSAANSFSKQMGGWTLTWQGTKNTLEDFPEAKTLKMALQNHIGAENVISDLSKTNKETIAIIVIGEDPYAEGFGNIKSHQTLNFARLKATYAADIKAIKDAKAAGMKVITVFYSGRPMYLNDGINHSDAFIAAWLPGSEASGIVDNLYQINGADFSGRLSYSWPNKACSTAISRSPQHIPNYVRPEYEQDITAEHKPLFAYGYGLSYAKNSQHRTDLDNLPLDKREHGCTEKPADNSAATKPMEIFGKNSAKDFALRVSGAKNNWQAISFAAPKALKQAGISVSAIDYQTKSDAVSVKFTGGPAQIYAQFLDKKRRNKKSYENADSTLQFDIRMTKKPTKSIKLAQRCVWPCSAGFLMNDHLPLVSSKWTTLKIPSKCFVAKGMKYEKLTTPFLIFTEGKAEFDVGNIRILPKNVDPAPDAISCSDLNQ